MKKLALVGVAGVLVALALTVWASRRDDRTEWTTCCPEAEAAFEESLDAARKFYGEESYRHLERAVEIDPEFPVARLMLAQVRSVRSRDRTELIAEIEAIDPTSLHPREQVIVAVARARYIDRDPKAVGAVLDGYLADHPDDAFVLDMACERLWVVDRGAAEACYEHLLSVDPNWVSAQNRLGYFALSLGRFDEAEERFTTYRYIAPDQANPHDSLGELLMVRGRWEEAEASLRRAIETRPDFCVSWSNLADIALYNDQLEKAQQLVEQARATEACRTDMLPQWCRNSFLESLWKGEPIDDTTRETCKVAAGDIAAIDHAAALARGDLEAAASLEATMAKADHAAVAPDKEQDSPELLVARALRGVFESDWPTVVTALDAHNEVTVPWSQRAWFQKMSLDLTAAAALETLGRQDEATARVAAATAVNPSFAKLFRERCTARPQPSAPRHILCPKVLGQLPLAGG